MKKFSLSLAIPLAIVFLGACSSLHSANSPVSFALREREDVEPKNKGEANLLVKESTKDLVYGDGIGRLITNVAAFVVFPPYGLVKLGEAGILLAGYEVDIELDEDRPALAGVSDAYRSMVSVPGRIVAASQGEEYRSEPWAKYALDSDREFRAWKNSEWYFRYSAF